MNRQFVIVVLLTIAVSFSACLDREYYKISVPTPTPSVSIPLVKLKTTIGQLAENASDNVRVQIDNDGRLTFFYEGQILNRSVFEVFPPIPWADDFPIVDSVAPLTLPIDPGLLIQKAIFNQSSIRFKFRTARQEDISVKMTMPELSKNGDVLEKNYEMKYDGGVDNYFESELIGLHDYLLNTTDTKLSFNYDARTASGERIVFDEAYMYIDFIAFSYMEGYFGNREFPLTGSAIPIGIFNNWISGGFSFDKPELTIGVDNSFGFPVTVFFSRLDLTTLSGNIFEIESTVIEDGIEFGYPEIAEGNVVKSTSFSINANNSNIEETFNEKATMVNYDILAIANPVTSDSVVGFFSDESFFSINTSLKLPIHTNIDDLLLSKTFDLDLKDYDQIESGELIMTIKNAMPLNAELQIEFEDSSGNFQSYFDTDSWSKINANDMEGLGIDDQIKQVFRFPMSETSWANIRQSNRMRINMKLNTENVTNDDYIWLFDYHGLDLAISATINQ